MEGRNEEDKKNSDRECGDGVAHEDVGLTTHRCERVVEDDTRRVHCTAEDEDHELKKVAANVLAGQDIEDRDA